MSKLMRLTKDSKPSDFACPCGKCKGGELLAEFLDKALLMLAHTGEEYLEATSGVRCKAHNKAVGGADNSNHLTGEALDIVTITQKKRDRVETAARKAGIVGFGYGKTFLHVDNRKTPGSWRYLKG